MTNMDPADRKTADPYSCGGWGAHVPMLESLSSMTVCARCKADITEDEGGWRTLPSVHESGMDALAKGTEGQPGASGSEGASVPASSDDASADACLLCGTKHPHVHRWDGEQDWIEPADSATPEPQHDYAVTVYINQRDTCREAGISYRPGMPMHLTEPERDEAAQNVMQAAEKLGEALGRYVRERLAAGTGADS
jgi:hypothetical protein